jgi:hypothetical protein
MESAVDMLSAVHRADAVVIVTNHKVFDYASRACLKRN